MTSKEFWCQAFLSNVVEYEYKFKDSIELAGLFADKCLKEYAKRFEKIETPIEAPIESPIAKKDESFDIGDIVYCSQQYSGTAFNAKIVGVDTINRLCTLSAYPNNKIIYGVSFSLLTKTTK